MAQGMMGPGPAAYSLPSLMGYDFHDITKSRGPQYSMQPGSPGSPILAKNEGLGPQYNTEYMTSHGKAHAPSYSLGRKSHSWEKLQSPGPTSYNVQNSIWIKEERAPSYSFTLRHDLEEGFQTPGPATYNVQNATWMKEERAPSYSFTLRHDPQEGLETPGPSDFNIPTTLGRNSPTKHSSGAFSMTDRAQIYVKQTSPGPAGYNTTDMNTCHNRAPSYSMQ